MKKTFFLTLILLLISCNSTNKDKTKNIVIQDYEFIFPTDFNLIEKQGIDSYVGTINKGDFIFDFDFGRYSNSFEQTENDYINNGTWKIFLSAQLQKPEVSTNIMNLPEVTILNYRQTKQNDKNEKNFDYIVKCKIDTLEYNYPLKIPNAIKNLNFKIDTINGTYRKIVWSKTNKGPTGIYMKNITSDNSLSLVAFNLTEQQKKIALLIFESAEYKPKKHSP
ncbi:hypothetical protein [Pseudomonas shirazensis]